MRALRIIVTIAVMTIPLAGIAPLAAAAASGPAVQPAPRLTAQPDPWDDGIAPTATPVPSLTRAVMAIPAPAALPVSVTPEFTCPDATVCVFQDKNRTGNVAEFRAATASEQWNNLTQNGLTLPWHSFNNNTGSSVVFGDAQTGAESCFLPGTINNNASSALGQDRFMWIEFGNTQCNGQVGPLPAS